MCSKNLYVILFTTLLIKTNFILGISIRKQLGGTVKPSFSKCQNSKKALTSNYLGSHLC